MIPGPRRRREGLLEAGQGWSTKRTKSRKKGESVSCLSRSYSRVEGPLSSLTPEIPRPTTGGRFGTVVKSCRGRGRDPTWRTDKTKGDVGGRVTHGRRGMTKGRTPVYSLRWSLSPPSFLKRQVRLTGPGAERRVTSRTFARESGPIDYPHP